METKSHVKRTVNGKFRTCPQTENRSRCSQENLLQQGSLGVPFQAISKCPELSDGNNSGSRRNRGMLGNSGVTTVSMLSNKG